MLKGKDIYKNHGDLQVLKGINLHVKKGEMVALVGPSGAGKSTLLHILGTIDKASAGEVWIDGSRVDSLSGAKMNRLRNQKIGFIFQYHHLLPEFSALENVCMPAWIAGRRTKATEKRAMELLAQLGLQDRSEHKPQALSGGECQRVSVARALINEPAIILADEPSGNLDQHNAQSLHDIFRTFNREFSQTFLIVTHNEKIVSQCDRSIYLQDGVIQ